MFSGCGADFSYSYRPFISHAWDYNEHYEGVKHLLDGDSDFQWEDLSVPFDDPLDGSLAFPRSYGTIVDQLRDRIREADVLLVIAGMYCAHRPWIQTEMEAAKRYGKPVIAIRPWGRERLPVVIREADVDVGWRTSSLVNAIRRLVAPRTPLVVPQATSTLAAYIGRNNLVPPTVFSSEPPGVGSLQMLAKGGASGERDNSSATSVFAAIAELSPKQPTGAASLVEMIANPLAAYIGRNNLAPPTVFSSEPPGVGSLQMLAKGGASGERDNSKALNTLAVYRSSRGGGS